METRYIVIAALIVVGVLALLAYRPADDVRAPVDRPRPTDRIVELPPASPEVPIATVELQAPPPIADQPEGAGADTDLIRRFEAESLDPSWAPIARERLNTLVGPAIEPHGGTVERIECRQTTCRLQLAFSDPTRRPAGVAAVTDSLAERRHLALVERVQDRRVSLVVAP